MTPPATNAPPAPAGPSGLTAEQRSALSNAAGMLSAGHGPEAAVDHLVATGMPRMVAKVLVKQQQRSLN
jgi:ATP/maltotriose-dependent transcriptional regulator MalT